MKSVPHILLSSLNTAFSSAQWTISTDFWEINWISAKTEHDHLRNTIAIKLIYKYLLSRLVPAEMKLEMAISPAQCNRPCKLVQFVKVIKIEPTSRFHNICSTENIHIRLSASKYQWISHEWPFRWSQISDQFFPLSFGKRNIGFSLSLNDKNEPSWKTSFAHLNYPLPFSPASPLSRQSSKSIINFV